MMMMIVIKMTILMMMLLMVNSHFDPVVFSSGRAFQEAEGRDEEA